MITGMDRLRAALEGRTDVDRIPVFCNMLDQGARLLGMPLRDYYANPQYVAEGQLTLRETYGYDNVWCLFYVGKEAEMLGCQKIIFAEDGPPNVEHFVIQSFDDIAHFSVPASAEILAQHPAMAGQLQCIELLRSEIGGRYPICAYVTASLTLPALLMSMEKWMELLMFGPVDLRDHLLGLCSQFVQQEIALLRAAGADVIVYSNPFGSTDFITMKHFIELSLPWMRRDLAPGGIQGIVYYCGSARFNNVIPLVLEQLKLGVYYLSPADDIAEAKMMIGDRALTCGIINDIKLISWTPDEVRAEVKRLLDAGMPGGRFLFGTILMPYAIPEANIRAMLETAYEYGRY